MSASIYYRVVKAPEGYIPVSASSSFVSAMDRAFGRSPWRVGKASLAILEGMAAVYGTTNENPYAVIVSKIQGEDGSTCELEIWPEY